MKRIFMLLAIVFFAIAGYAQSAKFAEVFLMSSNAADNVIGPDGKVTLVRYYDKFVEFCEKKGLTYIMYYDYTGEPNSYNPPEANSFIINRLLHLGITRNLPNVYLMGKDLMYPYNDNTVLFDESRWDNAINNSSEYSVFTNITDTKVTRYQGMSIITTKVELLGETNSNTHVLIFLTENFPITGTKHVFRQVLYEGPYNGSPIVCGTIFRPEYVEANCEITVMVEDDSQAERKLVGCSLTLPLLGFSNGVNPVELPVKIYPNPVHDELTIKSANEIKDIRIVDVTGRLIMNKTEEELSGYEYKIKTSNFPSGIYFISVNKNKPEKFIKQ